MDRRDFVKSGALAAASGLVHIPRGLAQPSRPHRITVETQAVSSRKVRLAALELIVGLRSNNSAREIVESNGETSTGSVVLTLSIDRSSFKTEQDYEISASRNGAILKASGEQALLYAVFDFLERQGLVFGIDGTTVPIDRMPFMLPAASQPWIGSPRFAVRGLLPWPDFLNCISVYNEEDFQSYFANMLRMRFNIFGMHVYTQNDPLAESYLSFDFAGIGQRATLEDSTMTSWGYLPQKTSTYKMGAAQFYDGNMFGSDATRKATGNWDKAIRTAKMLRSAFRYASELGICTGIGFEPYQNPTEIVRALPPEALSCPGGFIESRTAHALLERRLGDLLERYPMVDYVWLWEDENANWESRKKNIPLSITPFAQAHDFLRRHAPNKKLVLAGWGGVTRNFQSLHQRLPGDIIFSALNDSLGWDPVNEAFGKLDGRERWPIPWLEDDPSMWLPQFRASRFEMDMKRAESFGCQGMLGIHWRSRIVDPTSTYFGRANWDATLTATKHYTVFSTTQASGDRGEKLASLFVDCDQGRQILSTFTGKYDVEGHAVTIETTPDYDQGFKYWQSPFKERLIASENHIAQNFLHLASGASSVTEKERLAYFSGFVNMTALYGETYNTAHQLGEVLAAATKSRNEGKLAAAKATILRDGVPLWLTMAAFARRTMLEYQSIISTRDEQGQLASMQNKFVRIALDRLRLSIGEFIGEFPEELDRGYIRAIAADVTAPSRVFIPTRPSILKAGEIVRLFIAAPSNGNIQTVKLYTLVDGNASWNVQSAMHAGRNVFEATIGPFPIANKIVSYYVSATILGENGQHTAPLEAPNSVYTLNII
jgi:hypothetical protein